MSMPERRCRVPILVDVLRLSTKMVQATRERRFPIGETGLLGPAIACYSENAGARTRCLASRVATVEDFKMPEIVVYAIGGRSLDQKRALCKDITDAVVKNFKVEPGAVVITLVETAKTDKAKGGVLFSEMGQK
jgi:4-oxalocrotonate tautomerase